MATLWTIGRLGRLGGSLGDFWNVAQVIVDQFIAVPKTNGADSASYHAASHGSKCGLSIPLLVWSGFWCCPPSTTSRLLSRRLRPAFSLLRRQPSVLEQTADRLALQRAFTSAMRRRWKSSPRDSFVKYWRLAPFFSFLFLANTILREFVVQWQALLRTHRP